MSCMKCGKEVSEDQVFCPECLAEMERYPVKPGTPVLQCYNKADLVKPIDIPLGEDVVAISAKSGMEIGRAHV